MTTIENQRALDPIIEGLVKRIREVGGGYDVLKYVVSRLTLNSVDENDYGSVLSGAQVIMAVSSELQRHLLTMYEKQQGGNLNETAPGDKPESYVQCVGGQGTEHATTGCKNFQVQAENAAKGCCGSQNTVREIDDVLRKEVAAGTIDLNVCGSMPEDRDTEHMFSPEVKSLPTPGRLCRGNQPITEALTDEQIAAVEGERDEA